MRLALAGLLLWLLGAPAVAQARPTWLDWRASRDGASGVLAAEGFTMRITAKPGQTNGPPTPILRVTGRGAPPLTLTGVQGFDDPAALAGLVRLDPSSTTPAVLFMTYSAGAHCCTTLDVAALAGGRWRSWELRFNGGPGKGVVKLLPGRRGPSLVAEDLAFDYAFASHAGSFMVARVYGVRGGRLFDESADPRFAPYFRSQMDEAWAGCRSPDERNGACAGYVAAASIIGEHDAAWTRMLALYDRKSDLWPGGCRRLVSGECPSDQAIDFKDYPSALAWFLWRWGYYPPAPIFACAPKWCPPPPRTPMPRAGASPLSPQPPAPAP